MNETQMVAVLERVESMQSMSAQDEVLWAATSIAYQRCWLRQCAQIATKTADASQWPKTWPTGTALAVALILDRHDVLRKKGYTILEAVDRIGPANMQSVGKIQAELRSAGDVA